MADAERLTTKPNRIEVLRAYYDGVKALRSIAKTTKDLYLKDAALWANYSLEKFTKAFGEEKNEGGPFTPEFLTNSIHPQVPGGHELPVITKPFVFEQPGHPTEYITIFFGLEVDGPIEALKRTLTMKPSPEEQDRIKRKIELLDKNSVLSDLQEDSPELRSVAISVSFRLQQLNSASHPVPRLKNAATLARSRMLILPL